MTSTTLTASNTSNTAAQDTMALVGRALLAWLFIPSGFAKIAGFTGLVGYIASKGVPLPELCAAIAIAAELGLGLLLLFGIKARWAALGLAIFVAVITPIFHNYWAMPEAQQMMQKQAFNKNLAIVGGLLVVAAFGAGRFSFDGRRGRG
ncbi:MAG: DoxX family protein [Ramlibacter sp.]|nr:DoxX family protein [Ramlibacter sp.]